MKKGILKASHPVSGESVDRITLSLSSEDKAALSEIADQKRVSIAWVIRDAITRYLAEKSKKSEG
jgi:predicted transcriptional regulator